MSTHVHLITSTGLYRQEGPYSGQSHAIRAAQMQHQHVAAPGTPIVTMDADGTRAKQVLMIAGDLAPEHESEVAELRATTGT